MILYLLSLVVASEYRPIDFISLRSPHLSPSLSLSSSISRLSPKDLAWEAFVLLTCWFASLAYLWGRGSLDELDILGRSPFDIDEGMSSILVLRAS